MPIEYATGGDIFEADADALVNPVNTAGRMGKGLALEFKRRFEANECAYAAACERGEVRLGAVLLWEGETPVGRRLIVNFPTKGHWRSRSRLADVVAGLADLRRVIEERSLALGDLETTRVIVFVLR